MIIKPTPIDLSRPYSLFVTPTTHEVDLIIISPILKIRIKRRIELRFLIQRGIDQVQIKLPASLYGIC